MTIGSGISSLMEHRPSFIWDPINPTVSAGNIKFTVDDIDSVGSNEPFTVWDSSSGRFKTVYPDFNPKDVLGPVGDFSDGKVQQYWSSLWTDTNLGFSVSSPTTSGVLGQLSGTSPDILDGYYDIDVTYVDTDEAQDSVIELSQNRSGTYNRALQVLVKSVDGYQASGNVEIGFNESADTRVTDSSTWSRDLPGDRGWSAVMNVCPSGGNPIYITLKFKQNTGRWLVAAPMFYSIWSTMENIVRAPIPMVNGFVYERGQYQVFTTEGNLSIPKAGWLAMSMVLPDRSVSNGHLNYEGVSDYDFAAMFYWQNFPYRIRVIMSDTNDRLGVQLDNNGTSFSFLDLFDDWDDFQEIGLCATWGYSNGSEYASLYVNGNKLDSTFSTSDWFPDNLSPSQIYIGVNGNNSSAADCWISRVALGRQPLHRSKAREVSSLMKGFCRK